MDPKIEELMESYRKVTIPTFDEWKWYSDDSERIFGPKKFTIRGKEKGQTFTMNVTASSLNDAINKFRRRYPKADVLNDAAHQLKEDNKLLKRMSKAEEKKHQREVKKRYKKLLANKNACTW